MSQQTPKRYRYHLTNTPLDSPIQIGALTIEPIEEGQQLLKGGVRSGTIEICSAKGQIAIPEHISRENASEYIASMHLDLICLLLSLANRNSVRVANEIYEEFSNGDWVIFDLSLDEPLPSKIFPDPVPWMGGRLEEFLESALPILIQDSIQDNLGIVRSLKYFRSSYVREFSESTFLKRWTAFEILYSKHNGDSTILKSGDFNKLRKGIESFLQSPNQQDLLPPNLFKSVSKKLGELNRYPAHSQVSIFLQNVFDKRPDLIPTSDEIYGFLQVRNEITHTGTFKPKGGPTNYNSEIFLLRNQLWILVESVFFVLLGHDPNLIRDNWREAGTGSSSFRKAESPIE